MYEIAVVITSDVVVSDLGSILRSDSNKAQYAPDLNPANGLKQGQFRQGTVIHQWQFEGKTIRLNQGINKQG